MDQMRILIFAVERPKELMIKMVFIMKTIVIHMLSVKIITIIFPSRIFVMEKMIVQMVLMRMLKHVA